MSIRQSIPINLRPTDWIDTKANSKWIGLIEVPNLNQVQSIRQSGLIVANCVSRVKRKMQRSDAHLYKAITPAISYLHRVKSSFQFFLHHFPHCKSSARPFVFPCRTRTKSFAIRGSSEQLARYVASEWPDHAVIFQYPSTSSVDQLLSRIHRGLLQSFAGWRRVCFH